MKGTSASCWFLVGLVVLGWQESPYGSIGQPMDGVAKPQRMWHIKNILISDLSPQIEPFRPCSIFDPFSPLIINKVLKHLPDLETLVGTNDVIPKPSFWKREVSIFIKNGGQNPYSHSVSNMFGGGMSVVKQDNPISEIGIGGSILEFTLSDVCGQICPGLHSNLAPENFGSSLPCFSIPVNCFGSSSSCPRSIGCGSIGFEDKSELNASDAGKKSCENHKPFRVASDPRGSPGIIWFFLGFIVGIDYGLSALWFINRKRGTDSPEDKN